MATSAKEISDNNLSYFNGTCFLSNEDFDSMVAAKHAAEEAIWWKLLPENTVFRVENMSPIKQNGVLDVFFNFAMQMDKILMCGLQQMCAWLKIRYQIKW